MIVLWRLYVYHMGRVGVGSLKVQLKASNILDRFIVVVASGETKHVINNLKMYRERESESEVHQIINQKSIKLYKYNILRNKYNKLALIYMLSFVYLQ